MATKIKRTKKVKKMVKSKWGKSKIVGILSLLKEQQELLKDKELYLLK